MTFSIERPEPGDRPGWEALYRGYRAFYDMPADDDAIEAVWGWIQAPDGPLQGRIVRTGTGDIAGLMHFRDVPRPLEGGTGGWLDDLFVAEAARGSGVADALVDALCAIGRQRDWVCIRWLTSESNARARRFYERISRRTAFLTYEIRL